MQNYNKNWIKYIIGFITCLLIRFIPFRPPNVEPILTAQMPFSRHFGAFYGFLFGFLSIIVFDSVTSGLGVWTFVTASLYGLLGIFSVIFFKHYKANAKNYALFALMGVLFYDAFSGLTLGPILFHQSFMTALVGQIPFTFLHLVSAVPFAYFLSPAIDQILVYKKSENKKHIIKLANQYIS